MVELHNADCLEILRNMPDQSVDHVITDPPYDAMTHEGAVLDKPIDFAPLADAEMLVGELLRVSRGWVILFCSLEMLGEFKRISGKAWIRAGFWDRISNMPQMTGDRPAQAGEGVAIMHNTGKKKWNGGGKAAKWAHLVERGQKEHPTQKPVKLLREIVEQFTCPGETILDPFMGSGTTGVAALERDRSFIGVELSMQYFEVAKRRIEEIQQQGRLF